MTLSIQEKLIIFSERRNLSHKQVAILLEVTEEHLSRVLNGNSPLSDKLANKIEDLFRAYLFLDALDDKGRL